MKTNGRNKGKFESETTVDRCLSETPELACPVTTSGILDTEDVPKIQKKETVIMIVK